VLTAAHCVLKHNGAGIMKGDYVFQLNYDNGTYSDSSSVSYIWYGTKKPKKNRVKDWAILRLTKSLGVKYGYFKLGEDINTPVYDVSLSGFGQYFYHGEKLSIMDSCEFVDSVYGQDKLIRHNCDSSSGDSGAPIFKCSDISCELSGMHVAAYYGEYKKTPYLDYYSDKYANLALSVQVLREALESVQINIKYSESNN
jgi:V8-like Glu-specific endopeptidase